MRANGIVLIVIGILLLAGGAYLIVTYTNVGGGTLQSASGSAGSLTGTVVASTSTTPAVSSVKLAFLDPTGNADGPSRGCDAVVLVATSTATTTMPLTAALEDLFALKDTQVDGYYNFIAKTRSTLSFEHAEVSGGVARVYLTGSLSGLAGVCDNPRAAIQIEETAKQFSTVQRVQLYLNGQPTDLTPGGRGA